MRRRLRELRCFWSRPFGHAYECVDAFDSVAGRWSAAFRCVACGKGGELALAGHADADFKSSPLSIYVPYRAGRARWARRPGSWPRRDELDLHLPDGRAISLRCVRVAFGRYAGRQVYAVRCHGDDDTVSLSTDLREALAGVAPAPLDERWIENVSRQLGSELA